MALQRARDKAVEAIVELQRAKEVAQRERAKVERRDEAMALAACMIEGKGEGTGKADDAIQAARREEQENVARDFIQDMAMRGKDTVETVEAFMGAIVNIGKKLQINADEVEAARQDAAIALTTCMNH